MPEPASTAKRLLKNEDLENAAFLLARSFRDDPFLEYLVPEPVRRAKALPRFFKVFLRNSIRNRQVYGVGDPVAGIAIWFFPRQRRIDVWSLFRSGLLGLLFHGFFVPFLRAIKIFRIINRFQSKFVRESDYYLSILAVAPEWQGHGFASKLVRPLLELTDRENVGVYVETMTLKDVKIYTHFGFKRLEEHKVRSGFSIWALRYQRKADF